MIRLTVAINFWGTAFSPGQAESATGLLFTEKAEVGDTGKTGRYKNQPLPYGSASFRAPATVQWSDRVLWLAHRWVGKIDLVKACGAEDIHFWVGYYHDGQCNCTLSTDEIKALETLSIPYVFSVYQTDDLGETP